MDRRRRSTLVGGLILVLIGAWLVAVQLVPGLADWIQLEVTWPLFLVAIGVIFFVVALVTAVPGFAVPACIVAGVGAILYFQATSGRWVSGSSGRRNACRIQRCRRMRSSVQSRPTAEDAAFCWRLSEWKRLDPTGSCSWPGWPPRGPGQEGSPSVRLWNQLWVAKGERR